MEVKEELYKVRTIRNRKKPIVVSVPGSKSITNRALLLAALTDGECILKGALFSDDSRDMMKSLSDLGIDVKDFPDKKEIHIQGCGGSLPIKEGRLNVGNSGIAARFITVLACFSGGRFQMDANEQMRKRPMNELISALRELGAVITCQEKEGYFPFFLDGSAVKGGRLHIDTTVSSQFLSALIMSGFLLKEGLILSFSGRDLLPYVDMTVKVMEHFGLEVTKEEGVYGILGNQSPLPRVYEIEPDISSACYFYAMAVLLKCKVTVRGVRLNSIQGDIAFVRLLRRLGATLLDEEAGLSVVGSLDYYDGIEVNLNACSDQTMTLAALALFANGLTKISGIKHIRYQESDRLYGIYNEVIRLGAKAEIREGSITIFPMGDRKDEVVVETYHDHRMAMAFALVGLKREGVLISNPSCTKKTFEQYFDLLEEITKE